MPPTGRLVNSKTIPLLLGAVVALVVFAFQSAAATTYSSTITLVSNGAGTLGAYEHRNQAAAEIGARLAVDPLPGVSVRLEPRFNTFLDVVVEGADADETEQVAQRLADDAVAERADAATAGPRGLIDADEAALAVVEADLEDARASLDELSDEVERTLAAEEIAGLIDTQNALNTRLTTNRALVDGAGTPLAESATAFGETVAPRAWRDAVLAGLVAALSSSLVLVWLEARGRDGDDA